MLCTERVSRANQHLDPCSPSAHAGIRHRTDEVNVEDDDAVNPVFEVSCPRDERRAPRSACDESADGEGKVLFCKKTHRERPRRRRC